MTHRKDAPPTTALGRAYNSARLGFIPVPLEHAPLHVLAGVNVYVRSPDGASPEPHYALYREPAFPFSEEDRARLLAHGVRFVYVEMAEQRHIQRCVEAAAAPEAGAGACELVYSATVELINELLVTPDLAAIGPRLDDLSRTVAGLVVDHPGSFSHLFKVARHDFYTATHVVNVATWMVPLAYACGLRDPAELAHVFQAGILHDIGKIFVPAELLNRPGALSDDDWRILRAHPQLGYDHLRSGPGLPEAVLRATHEHHERNDGGGYPRGLRAAHLHPVSRICAVVDAFEAMTAMRPHRRRAHPLSHAVDTLRNEAATRYCPRVVEAWLAMIAGLPPDATAAVSQPAGALPETPSANPAAHPPPPPLETLARDSASEAMNRREHERHELSVAARVFLLSPRIDLGALTADARTIPRGGMSFGCRWPVGVGSRICVRLQTGQWSRLNLIGRVVRCQARADGTYDIGVRFLAKT